MDRANITDYSTRSGMKVSAAFLKLHRDILAGSTDEAWRSRALWPTYII